ncbi:HAD family phosphatase [Lactobacillus sp. ESL0701]|uniref:HAD family hydrolase n=1 Tax=Lactobacillus sp. ESL0701 TaxID=2983217 RepID=UPI0023F70621|nr:HAD family phosphatase [Lactobacillus sp. ESL0701]MDF7672133.1 HAD family phosphatase [Lactobacillus sp. ESL0701]
MHVQGIDEEIKGILFDMDGLLVNSENLYWQANIQASKEDHLDTPDDTYLKLVGSTTKEMRAFYQRYFKTEEERVRFIERTNELVEQWIAAGKLKLQPGVQRALDTFYELNLSLAVVSSNYEKDIEQEMWATGIRNYFQFHLNYDDVQKHHLKAKPAPDIYLWAAQKINIPKQNLLAFEDSSTGVAAASNAGLKCVMIPDLLPPTKEDQANATLICHDFNEFLEKVK